MRKINSREKAAFLKILAHPTRIMILEELINGKKCVNDIEELLAVRQANISQHLAMLRHAGVVDFCQKGKKRCYFLVKPKMIEAVINILEKEGR